MRVIIIKFDLTPLHFQALAHLILIIIVKELALINPVCTIDL